MSNETLGKRSHVERGRVQTFTRLEEHIIRELAHHISQNEEVSLTFLAEECHVSKSTVIKAVKKLGYQGFDDLVHNIRFNAQTSSGALLPGRLVEGDREEAVCKLAEQLRLCEGRRNFIFAGDRRTSDVVARYMSRKLAMFDLFATMSTDYAMARREVLECGTAFFILHRELPCRSAHEQDAGYGMGMLRSARDAGFDIVAFSDDSNRRAAQEADLLVRISPNEDEDIDLFVPKTLMVFEQALTQYARRRSTDDE